MAVTIEHKYIIYYYHNQIDLSSLVQLNNNAVHYLRNTKCGGKENRERITNMNIYVVPSKNVNIISNIRVLENVK